MKNYNKVKNQDTVLTRLYDSLLEAQELQKLIQSYKIPQLKALSDFSTHVDDESIFKFIGPSSNYYQELVNRFSSTVILEANTFASITDNSYLINEALEGSLPCPVVDEKNDTSAENLSSVITLFTTSSGKDFLFTGDAGVESFERAKADGFEIKNMYYAQLPHHGSRRNVSSLILCEINPTAYFVSAAGNKKHPRKAVIACIKKNINANIYSTHKTKNFHVRSDSDSFPQYSGYSYGNVESL